MGDDPASWYRRFHGRAPEWKAASWRAPAWVADLGAVASVTYVRETPRGPELREHVFAPDARPDLARDDAGGLHVLNGNFTVTERGIMDRFQSAMTRYSPVPSGSGQSAMVRYTPRGVPVHGRAMPREGVMVPRANPVPLMERARDSGGAILTGGVALVGVVGSDALVERTTWTEPTRAAAQGLGLLGAGVAVIDLEPSISRGLIAAGVVSGGRRMLRYWQIDRIVMGWWQRMYPGTGTGGQNSSGELPFDVRVSASYP